MSRPESLPCKAGPQTTDSRDVKSTGSNQQMMKFCCDKFKTRQELPRQSGLNIRVIKFSSKELIGGNDELRFFVTPGYSLGDQGVYTLNIAFCPFCGQNLFKFYKDDAYINEFYKEFLYH